MTKKKILAISSREICYYSGNFFISQLADAFERLGHEVTRVEFTLKDDLDAILVPLHGQNFDLIVDLNTQMCHLVDDERPVLDLIGGPFFDYVVDHPLFHYNSLHAPVKNLNAILIDRGQEKYVKKYHPNVNRTLFMPLGATEASDVEKRCQTPDSILVMSTFVDPQVSFEKIKEANPMLRAIMENIIELRMQNPLISTDDAFNQVCKEEGIQESDEQMALLLNACYPADQFIRNAYRKKCVDELLSKRIPLTLVGEGWDSYTKGNRHVNVERPLTFALSFHRIAKEHILLNNAPMFPDGMHDRIPAGMANHCAVLTDKNSYLSEIFEDKKEIAFYEGYDLATLSARAEHLLSHAELVFDMEEYGYQNFKKNHSWAARAEKLLSFVDTTID